MQSRLAAGVVFVIGCVAGGAASQMVVPKARANSSAPRWEYNCFDAEITDNFDLPVDELNKAGAQGWELVSMVPRRGGYGYCFKRPAP